jgi:hypothetical protein
MSKMHPIFEKILAPLMPKPARKIVTVNVYPPIPIRTMDWVAYWDGDEEMGPRGWGKTEAEAIADLENHDP